MQAGTSFPKVRRMLLCFSPSILTHFGLLTLRAPCSCHSVPSWDRSSNFGALGLRWWGSPGQNHSDRRILVSNVCVTCNGFREFYTSPYVWALPQNRWGFRRLRILTYATQLSCNFRQSHCTFITILFRPFARPFINLAVCMRAHFPKSATTLSLAEQALRRMPLLTDWSAWHGSRDILPHWTSSSGTSGFRRFLFILLHERIRRRIRLCRFSARFFVSCRKTAIVSCWTLPVSFPLPTVS